MKTVIVDQPAGQVVLMRTRDTEHQTPTASTDWTDWAPVDWESATLPVSYQLAYLAAQALLNDPQTGSESIVVTINVGSGGTDIRTLDCELKIQS